MGSLRRTLALLLMFSGLTTAALGQQLVPEPDINAEFEAALASFESEEYAVAFFSFRELYERVPDHPKTTAALLMAGKSLYRLGEYASCVELLGAFHTRFPNSAYLQEAERVVAFARLELGKSVLQSQVVRVGVALPLSSGQHVLTQALFNGIHMAVSDHNARELPLVQLIFRDTQNTAEGARRAVAELIDEGVAAIVGPLFSKEVHAAAREAERARVVLIAPLATDEYITRGRSYIFQANATLIERGRFMAREAVENLQLGTVGVVAEDGNPVSIAMARSFAQEAARRGAVVAFDVRLKSFSDWLRLPELIGIERLSMVDGLYLSVHREFERDVERVVQGALSRLGRTGSRLHILGASAWHGVELDLSAERLSVSYAGVFHVNEIRNDVRNFRQAYRVLSQGTEPDRLAYTGYDVMRALLFQVGKDGSLAANLKRAPVYDGLGTRIRFDDRQRNTALYLFNHSPGGGILAY